MTADIVWIWYIFADCQGFSRMHARASCYTALYRVSLRGVGPRCVGLAQKISARCNTGSYFFSFFFICIFILFLALSHLHFFLIHSARSLRFGRRLWKVNTDQNWNLFYHYFFQRPLLFITLFLKGLNISRQVKNLKKAIKLLSW